MKKCRYAAGTKRLDCLNAILRKLNRPLCSVCRTKIKIQPRVKAEPAPKIEELPVVAVETPEPTGPVLNINTDVPSYE